MNSNDEPNGEPLPQELVDAIDRVEPPAHLSGFWERLETSRHGQSSVSSSVTASDPGLSRLSDVEPVKLQAEVDQRKTTSWRSGGTALRAAAIVLVGAAGVGLLVSQESEPEPDTATPVSAAESRPTTSNGDTSTSSPSTAPSDSRPDPTTATTVASEDGARPPTSLEVEAPTVEPSVFNIASMNKPFAGGWSNKGWRMYGDSYIEGSANFSGGEYVINIEARGYSAGTFRPRMEVRVGDQVIGSVRVDLDQTDLYAFTANIPSGVQNVQIAFTNDPNRPDLDVDLEIRALAIRPNGGGPATR